MYNLRCKHIFLNEDLKSVNADEIDMLQELINQFLENNAVDIADVEYDVTKDKNTLHHSVLIFYTQSETPPK